MHTHTHQSRQNTRRKSTFAPPFRHIRLAKVQHFFEPANVCATKKTKICCITYIHLDFQLSISIYSVVIYKNSFNLTQCFHTVERKRGLQSQKVQRLIPQLVNESAYLQFLREAYDHHLIEKHITTDKKNFYELCQPITTQPQLETKTTLF